MVFAASGCCVNSFRGRVARTIHGSASLIGGVVHSAGSPVEPGALSRQQFRRFP
jgi:hypothetical protein